MVFTSRTVAAINARPAANHSKGFLQLSSLSMYLSSPYIIPLTLSGQERTGGKNKNALRLF